jgi:hypothetical protein
VGPWKNFALDAMKDGTTSTSNWADYPSLGVDNQALYVTSNQFAFGGAFQYAKLRVIPKARPYAGQPPRFFDFVRMQNADNSLVFTLQPCHTFGAPQGEYLVNTSFPSGNTLTLWRVTNPTGTPVLNRQQVTVSPYSLAPNADQSGGAPPLNTGDVRPQRSVPRGVGVDCFHHRAQLGRQRQHGLDPVVRDQPDGRLGGPARRVRQPGRALLLSGAVP